MSLASQFFLKGYAGLSQPGTVAGQLLYSAARTIFTVENTDTSSGAEVYPWIQLKNNKMGAGVTGAVQWIAQNSAAAFLAVSSLTASFVSTTAGAETSRLDQYAYIAGQQRFVSLRGDLAAWVGNGYYALGSTAVPWNGLFVGDGTVNGSMASNGSNAVNVGAYTNHALNLLTNNATRLTISASGQVAVNSAPDVLSLLSAGGAHLNSGASVRGVSSQMTTPASATGVSASFYSSPSTTATSYSSSVAHYAVVDGTKGAGSTLTNQYGLYVNGLTNGATNYGVYLSSIGGTTAWAVYSSGSAQSYFNGPLGIGDNTYPLAAALSISATQVSGAGNGLYMSGVTGGNAIRVIGASNSASWNGMLVTDVSSGNTKFQVGGSGLVFINSAAQVDNALLTLVGRLSISGNVAYDLISNQVGSTIYCSTSGLTIGTGQSMQLILMRPSISMSGTGTFYGITSQASITASASGNAAYGVHANIGNAGAGPTTGGYFGATATGSATGALIGLQGYTLAVGTSGAVTIANLSHAGLANVAVAINAINAGDQLNYGVYIDATSLLNTYAFAYDQRSGATGGFLRYNDASSALRFAVDVNGDVILGGTGRRIKGDFGNGTATNRPSFVNANSSAATYVQALPSSGGTVSAFIAHGNPDPANASLLILQNDGAAASLIASQNTGAGTLYPLRIGTGSAVSIQVETNADVRLGNTAGLVTSSTVGFPYIPSVAGTPTGVPTARTGFAPIVYDSTNHKLCVYDGGWKSTAALT